MALSQTKISICFFLPHFRVGGLEQIFLNTMLYLDKNDFSISLLLLNSEGDLITKLPQHVSVFHMGNTRSSLALPRLVSKLNQIAPDIVYSGTNATNLMVLFARIFCKQKFCTIISEHTPLSLLLEDSKWVSLRMFLMRRIYPTSDLFAAPVVDICNEHKDLLRIPSLKTMVLDNPVLLAHKDGIDSTITEQLGFEPFFLAVGRLAPEKQFDFLIECFSSFIAQKPDYRLIILGEGSEREKLTSLIQQKGLETKVILFGYAVDLVPYYRNCVALLSSSRREGFGNALVEAMDQGAPVISTDCPFGPKNILRNGEAGILVQLDSATDYVNAMIRIADEPELRRTLSAKGKASVSKYKIGVAVKQFELVCQKLHRLRE